VLTQVAQRLVEEKDKLRESFTRPTGKQKSLPRRKAGTSISLIICKIYQTRKSPSKITLLGITFTKTALAKIISAKTISAKIF
jgi:hypothetical protein